jgi:hypothetical protein
MPGLLNCCPWENSVLGDDGASEFIVQPNSNDFGVEIQGVDKKIVVGAKTNRDRSSDKAGSGNVVAGHLKILGLDGPVVQRAPSTPAPTA